MSTFLSILPIIIALVLYFTGHPDRVRALCCGADLLRLY